MEKIKKYGLLYLSIDAVYQISLKSEMGGVDSCLLAG
jgi:hypothetical protein